MNKIFSLLISVALLVVMHNANAQTSITKPQIFAEPETIA
jgi:hypothetical protein